MNEQERQLIRNVWIRLTGKPFDLPALAWQIRFTGGHDMKDMSVKNICDMFAGRYDGDWYEVQFSFNELLPFYQTLLELNEGPVDGENAVIGVFALLALADARDIGARDIEQHKNNMIKAFASIKDKLTVKESVLILKRMFDPMEYIINNRGSGHE